VVIVTEVIVTRLNQHWSWEKFSYTIYNEIVFKHAFFKMLLLRHDKKYLLKLRFMQKNQDN